MKKVIIEWIRPHCFRAFGECDPIVFEDQLTIFFGGNASGKSSLAEAIEWLLLGYTTRRRKGDDLSKEEYRGSYARNMQNCPDTPFVEAKIRLDDGTTHLIRRTMTVPTSGRFDDTQSELTIDGVSADFSDIGLSVLPVYNPVVTQHGVQDFIHTRPIDRYRAISDALGLTDLVAFKDALDSARSAYRNNPPDRVTKATSETRVLPSYLRDLGLEEIATRWSNQDYHLEEDFTGIISVATVLVERDVGPDIEQLLQALRNEQAKEMCRVFDISPFRPRADSDKLLQSLDKQRKAFEPSFEEFVQAAHAVLEVALTEFEEQRIAFWQTGLHILDKSVSRQCPFCENTIAPALIEKRRNQVDRAKGNTEAKKSLSKKAKACVATVAEALRILGQIRIKSLADEDVARLKAVFDRSQEALQSFLEACKQFDSTASRVCSQMESMNQRVQDLQEAAAGAQAAEIPRRAKQLVQELRGLTKQFSVAFHTYSKAFSEFEPVLRVELADEEEVRKYTAAIALLERREDVAVCAVNRQLEDDLLEHQRLVAKYVKQKQQEVLNVREAEMLAWYDRLSPGATTAFSGIEPATDRFILKADCFGNELSAPACLSHSQLNCLGLSIWIPSVTAPLSPFQFLVFDDPVQAMDDEHTESFIVIIVPYLVEQESVQVVVLTHLKRIADRLREDHYHLRHRYYNFDSLSADGVRLSGFYPVGDEIGRIKILMKSGGASSRKLAVDRIRVLCEHIIREAYLKERGCPLPDKYLVARPSELFKPLNELNSVTQKQKQRIVAAVKWSDPAHHTDKTWQVPSTSNIMPHLNRLENIVKDLGLT